MKRFVCVMAILLTASMMFSCGKTEYLRVDAVETDENGRAKDPDTQDVNLHDLFSNAPGTWIPMYSFNGSIDSVGTTIVEDFDGDGIINENETTTNVWVADYPMIETNIATPVTMKIEIFYDSATTATTSTSEISSADVTRTADRSTENVHRNEVNERTVQYQDTEKTSSSKGKIREVTVETSASIGVYGASASVGTKNEDSSSQSSEKIETKWRDVPFKNNLQRDGWEMKSSDASKNARQLRNEIKTKTTATYKVKANAGYVRAALYLTNESVNMPVHISNILCSFLLQTPEGALIPVQSFRLRNDDYSLFEIDVYGGDTIGPYVVDLENLNTMEIKDAISRGYNPRIFIVDYKMTHVENSNYREVLPPEIQSDNLKIVEENAKGRTAGVKIVSSGYREFFRVVAFDTNGIEDRKGVTPASGTEVEFSPGITLEKALKRIVFSLSQDSSAIEFANYVFDMTGMLDKTKVDALKASGAFADGYGSSKTGGNVESEGSLERFFVRGIKRINGIENRIPVSKTITESDGNTTYIMKPIKDWTEEEQNNFKMWVVFDKGKYYVSSDSIKKEVPKTENGVTYNTWEVQRYNLGLHYDTPIDDYIPKFKGITNIIWPGDHYDIVYIDMIEYLGLTKLFGHNPFETGEELSFNTRWKMDDFTLNDDGTDRYYFYPEERTTYLGEAAIGDTIEFKIKLDSTYYLNPSFGEAIPRDGSTVYENFSYNWRKMPNKYDIWEALDLELCFGLGGEYTNWVNLKDDRSPFTDYVAAGMYGGTGDVSWDFLNQEFIVNYTIPYYMDSESERTMHLTGVGADGLVKVYLRTALNNAYRESIWPLDYRQVKQFRGMLSSTVKAKDTVIALKYCTGTLEGSSSITIMTDGLEKSYGISTSSTYNNILYITLSSALEEAHNTGDEVYINFSSGAPTEQNVKFVIDDDFYSEWNSDLGFDENTGIWTNGTEKSPLIEDDSWLAIGAGAGQSFPDSYWPRYSPPMDLGFAPGIGVANWLGNNNLGNPSWNNWADASGFYGFLNRNFAPFLYTTTNPKGIRLLPNVYNMPASDILISTTNTNRQVYPMVAISGDRALVVWESEEPGVSNFFIRGRIIDLATGLAIGDDFLVSTTNIYSQFRPQVAISGTLALVVWDSYDSLSMDIRGRIIDLSLSTQTSSDFFVSTTNFSSQTNSKVTISGTQALVVWDSYDNGNNHDIRGRIIDMTSSTQTGSDFLVSTTNTNDQTLPDVAISGAKALVVWNSYDNGSDYDIRGRIIDIITGSAIGDDFLISTINMPRIDFFIGPKVAISGSKALAVWQFYNGYNNYDIRGRIIDMTSSTQTSSDFLVSTTNTLSQNNPQVVISGTKALVVWESSDNRTDYNIRGRFIDMTLSTQTSSDFLAGTTNTANQFGPQVAMSNSGAKVLVVWQSNDNGSDYDIRSRYINAMAGLMIGNDFLVSTTNTLSQNNPQVAISGTGDKALVVWQSNDNGSNDDIRGRIVNLLDTTGQVLSNGLNNFLVSPLIERNYKVNVQLK